MVDPREPQTTTDIEQLADHLLKRLQRPETEPLAVARLKGVVPTFILLFGFGGQITFTVIPTITKDEDIPSDWSACEVRIFLSLAWLFFMLGLGLSSAIALVQVYGGESFARRLGKGGGSETFVNVLCALLQILIALAFLFLSLVVVAYTPAIGWVNAGVSCLCVAMAVGALILDMF